MRYFMRLAYCGKPFHGWQSQPNAVSVQEVLEKALSMLLRSEVKITGAGRTDTEVNAAMMIAHFDTDLTIDGATLADRLNAVVGKDIAVYTIFKVADDAHARFSATSRTYKYFLHTVKSPFSHSLSWHCRYKLDFEAMNEAAERLLSYTDFTSFSKLHTDVATNNCRVTHARWQQVSDSEWVFTITADRFLRNMVRAIVGTLVDVGRHKISVERFCEIIEQKNRCEAGTSMPGNALFLWNVGYPFEIE